jgi:hypothetical protein
MCVDRGELREGPGEATDGREPNHRPRPIGEAMRREMMNGLCGHYSAPAQGLLPLVHRDTALDDGAVGLY